MLLYLKFNEPGGNYLNSYVCLDSSSNKVHGVLLDENNNIIQDTSIYLRTMWEFQLQKSQFFLASSLGRSPCVVISDNADAGGNPCTNAILA